MTPSHVVPTRHSCDLSLSPDGVPRHLHSFPTRRSSDLVDGSVAQLWKPVSRLGGLRARYGTAFVTGNHEYYSDDLARSEEHTSELQSRLHVVCRLLLEKK